ncbi:MAG TPA: hypothetical protein VN920_06385 [Pyrinomonadaceae bacterium]|nr:hypothetical protein [Pyrinomonadaceae bacterium]
MFKLTVLVLTIAIAAVAALGQAPTLQIVTPDGPNLPADLFYGNVKVKPLRLRPGTNTVITIDDSDFFVNQHYVDFLNRFPDPGGFGFWNSKITACGVDATCIHNARVDVSNAFSFELEFGQSANYVYRLYRESFGNTQPFANPDGSNQTEANKIPLYSKFKADRQVVVGGANLAQQQLDLANAFVLRSEFVAKYPASLATAAQFVDAVLLTIQNDLGVNLAAERNNLITLYNSGGRGAVIYRLADDNAGTNPINNRTFIDAEYNRAFVYAQYGGYLRRDGDIGGFLFWLGQVNGGPLRDLTKQRAMVCSFITSDEYQLRFGNSVTHHNSECN